MNRQISTEDSRQKLVEHNLRVTHQRLVIYMELYSSLEHPTAEMIYSRLVKEYPTLSLATVYKTLDTFAKSGLIKKLKSIDDSVHYDADLHFHNHLICNKTKKIVDYKDEELNKLVHDYFKSKKIDNFDVQEVSLKIFGEILN
ncbi:MAG: transcriptional repressor [Bacteroidetes bacterium]|nr:transcriptional repressor [Bacteroidota bacterium]MBL6963429.1 transcriptional repressor [Bacteroidota bacterium]